MQQYQDKFHHYKKSNENIQQDLNNKIKNLNHTIDDLETLNKKYKGELTSKNNSINELTSELEKSNDNNFTETQNFLFEIEKLKNKIKQLQSELSNKNFSNETLNSRLEDYKKDFEDQKNQIKKIYDNKIMDMKSQIENETKSLIDTHYIEFEKVKIHLKDREESNDKLTEELNQL